MFSKNQPARMLSMCQFVVSEFSWKPTSTLLHVRDRTQFIRKRRYCKPSGSIILESQYGPAPSLNMNLPQYIWKDVAKWADKPMVTCGISGQSLTYGHCRESSLQFTSALISQLGFKKGDVLGLLLPNIPEYPVAIAGAVEAGIIVTFMNPLYTPDEVLRQFENADTKCCITIPQLLPVIEKIAPRLKNFDTVIVVGAKKANVTSTNLKILDFDELVSSQSIVSFEQARPEDIAILPYSSGTTGLPKGVMLTHENCVINMHQLDDPGLISPVSTTESFQECQLSVLPFFHIYGFNNILNIAIRKGIHLVTLPKFTPETYIQCLLKYQPTELFVVPSMLLFLASHPSVKPEYLKSVKHIVSGAASATKSLIENFKTKFNHGVVVRQGYGMTELSPCALLTPLATKSGKEVSVGKLVRGTSARIVSLNTGEDQPAFQSGELYIKGPQIMKGYWKNDKATQETVDSENWIHTGDVAYYDDDHYFYIIDRTKELIKVKGNQVSPTELENLILQLPQVSDVAVVGVPDTLADEVPKAFVVIKQGTTLSEESVINHVSDKVVNYKRLTGGVKFIDAIPRNAAGKILRKELQVLHRGK